MILVEVALMKHCMKVTFHSTKYLFRIFIRQFKGWNSGQATFVEWLTIYAINRGKAWGEWVSRPRLPQRWSTLNSRVWKPPRSWESIFVSFWCKLRGVSVDKGPRGPVWHSVVDLSKKMRKDNQSRKKLQTREAVYNSQYVWLNMTCKWQVEMIIISCQWLSHVTATFFKLAVELGTSRCVTFVLDRQLVPTLISE